METAVKFKTPDDYLASLQSPAKKILQQLRSTIKKAAPQAEESISYNMPAFKLNGPLVYYAACKDHTGFYPMPSAIIAFKKELGSYQCSKGAIQFPIDDPLPVDLITKIVKFRVKENLEKSTLKARKKK